MLLPLTAGAAARAAQRLALHAGRELPWAVCVGPGRVQVSKHPCSFSGGCGLSGRRMLMPTAAGCSGAWAALEVSCRYPFLHRVKSQPCLVPPAQGCLAGEMASSAPNALGWAVRHDAEFAVAHIVVPRAAAPSTLGLWGLVSCGLVGWL